MYVALCSCFIFSVKGILVGNAVLNRDSSMDRVGKFDYDQFVFKDGTITT